VTKVPWWEEFRDVLPHELLSYSIMEAQACQIDMLNMQYLPWLLQTEPYARSVLSRALVAASPTIVEKRVQARMRHQWYILEKQPPPITRLILDEALIHRQIGGQEILREQLLHITHVSQLPEVEVRILPFTASADIIATTDVYILKLPGANGGTGRSVHYMGEFPAKEDGGNGPFVTNIYQSVFESMWSASLDTDQTLALLRSKIRFLQT
jgi:hypothetical protein